MRTVLRNGRIYDGTGNSWYEADVAIEADRIVEIGSVTRSADREIDVQGLAVAPGFIDIHTHSDTAAFVPELSRGKVLQGVTTEVIGNCGMSLYPVASGRAELLQQYVQGLFGTLSWAWSSLAEFARLSSQLGTVTNLAPLLGHGAVRIAVMGFEQRDPTARELDAMGVLVEQAMEQGAFGLSSGLIYPPGVYSQTEELVELSRVVHGFGGFYATHMRNESDRLVESVQEAIDIGRLSGCPVQISHHKATGRKNWGKPKVTIPMIRQARVAGVDVDMDVYPYTASSTLLSASLPPWALEGGVQGLLGRLRDPLARSRIVADTVWWDALHEVVPWAQVFIASAKNHPNIEGANIEQLAQRRGLDAVETVLDILLEEDAAVTMIRFAMSEEDVRYILQQPEAMVGSDGIPDTGKTHPRYYGTFAKVLGHYVHEEQVLRLEDAVRKMTSLPAKKLGLKDRGLLREGAYADIAVFDPDKVMDRATYEAPTQTATGVAYVFVNGNLVVEGGEFQLRKHGRFIRHGI